MHRRIISTDEGLHNVPLIERTVASPRTHDALLTFRLGPRAENLDAHSRVHVAIRENHRRIIFVDATPRDVANQLGVVVSCKGQLASQKLKPMKTHRILDGAVRIAACLFVHCIDT